MSDQNFALEGGKKTYETETEREKERDNKKFLSLRQGDTTAVVRDAPNDPRLSGDRRPQLGIE